MYAEYARYLHRIRYCEQVVKYCDDRMKAIEGLAREAQTMGLYDNFFDEWRWYYCIKANAHRVQKETNDWMIDYLMQKGGE